MGAVKRREENLNLIKLQSEKLIVGELYISTSKQIYRYEGLSLYDHDQHRPFRFTYIFPINGPNLICKGSIMFVKSLKKY